VSLGLQDVPVELYDELFVVNQEYFGYRFSLPMSPAGCPPTIVPEPYKSFLRAFSSYFPTALSGISDD
jgi:hypothetical protein